MSAVLRMFRRLRCWPRRRLEASRPACAHEWRVRQVVKGATAGWDGEITREFDFEKTCGRCGAQWVDRAMVVPGDRRFHPECYGPDGWPIDPKTGARLPQAGRGAA